jgi:hypothetical protein
MEGTGMTVTQRIEINPKMMFGKRGMMWWRSARRYLEPPMR